MAPIKKIAVVGNPNSGKSSLFNILTGLRQKVSNFPGVTVDKKEGVLVLTDKEFPLTDMPGLYSVYPNSSDEKLVVDILLNPNDPSHPDLVVYVADVNNLERHMLLASQVIDLGFPVVMALNQIDLFEEAGHSVDAKKISKELGVSVVKISSRNGTNIDLLKAEIEYAIDNPTFGKRHYDMTNVEKQISSGDYKDLVRFHHRKWLSNVQALPEWDSVEAENVNSTVHQIEETLSRFSKITALLRDTLKKIKESDNSVTGRIDRVITHPIVGPIIFLTIMLLVFQAIYAWATVPMDWIEGGFGSLGSWVESVLPESWFSDLMVNGVLAGLGGVIVFVPQIFVLFLLIALLEESGYMSRAVYMFDGIMQKFGLNGRSIVALVSSGACAIPAIMSARTISNWKERLNTILVAPLISCSARIPVYTVLIGFVVPKGKIGIFNYQGLAFMGLYLLGIVAALATAFVIDKLLKKEGRSSLMIELPMYKRPIWSNVFHTVKDKVWAFISSAGKIIFFISILLWFLASYGPGDSMMEGETQATVMAAAQELNEDQTANLIASKRIENSYAGHLGKIIEPVIKPLGFDWKIGIALITSFAAREVFVGTMATIYSIGSDSDERTVSALMAQEVNAITGEPVYNFATSLSLLLFYVFAMQCMSTLAVTKRETNSWKWPMVQLVYMTGLAYLSSLVVYQLFS